MEDGQKLLDFLSSASKEKILKLIERLEASEDIELIEYALFLKSIFR